MEKVLSKEQRELALVKLDDFFLKCSSKEFYGKNFLRTVNPASYMILSFSKKDGSEAPRVGSVRLSQQRAACHGSFPQSGAYYHKEAVLASNFDYLPGEEYSQRYLSYLVDPKISPYRSLLANGYSIHYASDGRPAGISLFLEDVPQELWPAIKNFFIACRMARECETYTRNFHDMVEGGLDPRLAHLLMAQVSKRADRWYCSATSAKNTGHHWPLSVGNDGGFSISRFWNSDLNASNVLRYVNGLFNPRSDIEPGLTQGYINERLKIWRKERQTSFAPESGGMFDKIETLNKLLIESFVKDKGLVL